MIPGLFCENDYISFTYMDTEVTLDGLNKNDGYMPANKVENDIMSMYTNVRVFSGYAKIIPPQIIEGSEGEYVFGVECSSELASTASAVGITLKSYSANNFSFIDGKALGDFICVFDEADHYYAKNEEDEDDEDIYQKYIFIVRKD